MMNAADHGEGGKKPPESGEERAGTGGKGKKSPSLLLLILALIFLLSSVIAGILLGNQTDHNKKPAADSFVIGDIEESENPLHLAGRITQRDGTPFADGSLELHSEVRKGKTDSQGWFLFDEVESGIHSLFLLDEAGKTLAELKVELRRNPETEYSQIRIEKTAENQYCCYISQEIRFLELDLELEKGVLTLRMDKTAAVGQEGSVNLPGQVLDAAEGPVVLPSGTSILPDGRILHGMLMIMPDNQIVQIPKEGITLEDGTQITEAGTITLSDGTVISSTGVQYPGEERAVLPEYPVQLKPEAGKGESGLLPTAQAVGEENTESKAGENADGGEKESETPGDESRPEESSKPQKEELRQPDKVESDDPSETLAPDYGDLGVHYEENGVWNVWNAERSIHLFDYAQWQGSTPSSAVPIIKPGSSGWYPFQVTNTFSSHTVKIRVTVTEETIHLPLCFRLVTVSGNGQETAVSDWSSPLTGSKNGVVVANANASPPGSTVQHHLEWKWPYDSGRDGMDTRAAMLTSEKSRTHTLKLEINARR